MIEIVEAQNIATRKVDHFLCKDMDLQAGEACIVHTDKGLELVRVLRLTVYNPAGQHSTPLNHKVLRKATQRDIEVMGQLAEKEMHAFQLCRQKVEELGLEMKLVRVEYIFDGSRAIFYYTAEGRVDFRDLVKKLVVEVKTRVEMKQIGVREAAAMLGGVSFCGRPACCASYLHDFDPVSLKIAKQMNFSVTPSRMMGLCGRLKCCLIFESSEDHSPTIDNGKGALYSCPCADNEETIGKAEEFL